MEKFTSPVFGETRHATDAERTAIRAAVLATPVAVFQELNKALNERKLCLLISTPEEVQ